MTRLASILLILFALAHHAAGQTIIGKSFVTEVPDIRVYHMDLNENRVQTTNQTQAFTFVRKGTRFTVLNLVGNGAVVRFWRYGEEQDGANVADKVDYTNVGAYVNASADGKHFLMELTDLDSKCKEYFGFRHDFTWGAVTIPLKMRFGDADDRYFGFEPTANLGLFAGWRRQIRGSRPQSFNLLLGTSASNVTLRDVDVDMISYLNTDSTATRPENALAISASIGTVYQIESFQFGLFIGLDFIPGQDGRFWRHQGIPWLGLGIGFGLFSKEKTGHGTGKNIE